MLPGIWPVFINTYGTEDVTGAWSNALQGVPLQYVEMAIKRYARVEQEWPPTPGQFYATCKEIARSVTTARVEKKDKIKPATLRENTWKFCARILGERLIGDLAKVVFKPKIEDIRTGFPFSRVVYGVKLDDVNPKEQGDTHVAFTRLRDRFDEAWKMMDEVENEQAKTNA